MKKIFLIIFILFIFNNVQANTNFAFINMDKIISTSKPGSFFLNQLQDLNNDNVAKFKKNEKVLKEREKKLISQKNIISEDKFNSEINNLKLDIKNYNDNRNKVMIEFNKLKIDNTNKFLKLTNSILTKYSDKNSISIIFQKKNIIMGKTEFDITDKIIEIINKDIEEFRIK
tara:strand:- start:3083 stop:3598 length:516 start_codon:yes stop_codon:yes gene_type:complete